MTRGSDEEDPGDEALPEEEVVPVSVKRWTLCLLRGHRWARTPYEGSEGSAYFIRCTSCRYENHNAAMPGRPNLL